MAAHAAFAAPAAAQSADVLAEITVTAQRRAQSLEKVPIAAEAFSSADIEELNIRASTDIAQLVTNVSINNSYGNANPVVVVRGVGLQDFSANITPAVAFYVDEVYVPSPAMAGFQLFDVERIELLKGPQGTLYGRNTTGGAVNFITRKPSQQTDGYVKLGAANHETYNAEFAVGGALSERVSGRLSGQVLRRDEGQQRNIVQNRDQGRIDTAAARAHSAISARRWCCMNGIPWTSSSPPTIAPISGPSTTWPGTWTCTATTVASG